MRVERLGPCRWRIRLPPARQERPRDLERADAISEIRDNLGCRAANPKRLAYSGVALGIKRRADVGLVQHQQIRARGSAL